MFKDLLKKDFKTILNGFKWTSIILTSIVLIIFLISYLNDQKPEIDLFIIVILSTSIGFPLFFVGIALLRWRWDYAVTVRNFNSAPFNQLGQIGFKKELRNEHSYWKNLSECYVGAINDYIVECDVDTQNENKILRFNYFVKPKKIDRQEFGRISKNFKDYNGYFDFDSIIKKYHYRNHNLESIFDLEKDLKSFADLLKKENIEPGKNARC